MSLIGARELLEDARKRRYAVGYFEAWNLESLCAIVRAAELVHAPVMTGFCGEYLADPKRALKQDLALHATLANMVAQSASVPVATLLNECIDMSVAYRGVSAGFSMVMFVSEAMALEELAARTKHLVEFAHACDVAVETEVGNLGLADQSTGKQSQGWLTDPRQAAEFVQETGADALAVSVGNVHFLEGQKASLNFNLLEELHRQVSVPLVLHGGTGVDKADFKPAIERGITKVNVGSSLKRAVIESERHYFTQNDVERMNPNDVLGRGGKLDIAVQSQAALIDDVLSYIRAFGGENQAN